MHSVDNGSNPELRSPAWINLLALALWLPAAAVAFVPFARDTSPWNAVTLHVPGNQGNWWHALVGAPFFLAYPMVGLRLRMLFSRRPLSAMSKRLILGLAILSAVGTTAVEAPFLAHLAGTSEWQRFLVLALGFGILIGSFAMLFLYRRRISPVGACIAGLDAAYLANASLCLLVYAEATGSLWSRVGWFVTAAIVWPIAGELLSELFNAARSEV